MTWWLVLIFCALYLASAALPLLKHFDIHKPSEGWKKIEDEE